MNKLIKCILIDLDGTLINSGPDLIDSLNHVLKKNKLKNIDENIIGSLVGGGARAMIQKAYNHLKKKMPEKKMESMVSDFLDFYYQNCDKKSHLYPKVYETLKILNQKYKIALCTNKKQYISEKILKSFDIEKYFDFVLGSSQEIKYKPDTEMLKLCLKKLNSQPENSIIIGDSDNDILPAKKLKMKSVYVNYGYGILNDLIKPDFEINSFDEVIEVLNI